MPDDLDWTEPDLLVIGAGGCGLMAALVAAEAGSDVLVVEKTSRWGGGTALSHRGLRAAGTPYQRDVGVEDSPEMYAEEILRRSGCADDEELVRALTEISAPMIEFLADVVGVEFHLDEFTFAQSASRSHRWLADQPITDLLFATANQHPRVALRFDTPVKSLVSDLNGVVGVRTDRGDLPGRKTLLATGGFGANPELLARYIPHAAGVVHPGHEGSTGEGIEMGMALGAAVRHMDAFQPYPAHVGPGKRGIPPGVILSGGIVVDRDASRFVDETRYPGGLARAILDLDTPIAYEIFDQGIFDAHRGGTAERSVVVIQESGVLHSAGSIHALAMALGLDPARLEQTAAEYSAATGGVDSFGRRVERGLEPPFYGTAIQVALYHTQGGLAVDRHGRVLRDDGEAIANLYAGGGAAAGVSGDGIDGYLPGNGLLASLGLGMIAATHAVAAIAEEMSDVIG